MFINPLQESHRVKLLVGAVEVALEQETMLAIVRVVASFSDNLSPPAAHDGRAVRSGSAAVVSSSADPCTGLGDTPAASAPPPAVDGGGDSGGALSMPMLPRGVSASVVVDLAAVSVALTESGANVVAVALSAAHCKINVRTVVVPIDRSRLPNEARGGLIVITGLWG